MDEWENIVPLNVQTGPDRTPCDIVLPFLAVTKVWEQKFPIILMLGTIHVTPSLPATICHLPKT
jgi:hypothetical protein